MPFQHHPYTCYQQACLCCLIRARNSIHDGVLLFYQPYIHFCFERLVLFLGNMFKFLGDNQFLEVCATSQETMLFHDHGFVLLRFVGGFEQ